MKTSLYRRRERGLSLLELAMALALSAAIIAGMAWLVTNAEEKLKLRNDAQLLNTVTLAANAYVVANRTQILTQTVGLPGLQTVHVTGGAPSLVSLGFLPGSFQNILSNGQFFQVQVQALDPGGTGHATDVGALVVSYDNPGSSHLYDDSQAGGVVRLAGASAGFVASNDSHHNIDGAGGGWAIPAASWDHVTPGHIEALVGVFGAGNDSKDQPWLARLPYDVAPDHTHNTMETDIYMTDSSSVPPKSFSLLGASSVTADDYEGLTPGDGVTQGSDINIGSKLTPAPNIYIGTSVASYTDPFSPKINLYANSMNLSAGNYLLTGVPVPGGALVPSTILSMTSGTFDIGDPTVPAVPMKVTVTGDQTVTGTLSAQKELSAAGGMNVTGGSTAISSSSYISITGPGGNISMPAGSGINVSGGPTTISNTSGALNITSAGTLAIKDSAQYIALFPYNGGVTGEVLINNLKVCVAGDSSCSGTSDRRLKFDIQSLTHILDQIDRLKGHTFRWKKDGRRDIGVIAQEVETVYPELVHTDPKTGIKSVEYQNLVAPLIEAVKALHQRSNAEDASILALQQQNQSLQTDLLQQRLDFIHLKYAIKQPLSAEEQALCGAICVH